ncbi:MAG: bifunctional 4-hydroxy-2-oxoglutarate aldolase/2-dehydro-3-deoxy-phosphogluconate aldolase [Sphaerochaetaceae bacterium]|nr:bifunctional 4-hydroxy-2-oxoglutarate aldolase/2-dehydro-3-deoxy-phosphogluconate aldolase [Sphaerochaetaceae bacterium]
MNEVFQELEKRGVVAVLVIDDVETAVPTAKALVEGGITAIELALRTDAALESIKRIHKEVSSMMIMAGTVIRPDQLKLVQEAGADAAVAPGMNLKVMKEAKRIGLPFAPGICTASEIEAGIENGVKYFKYFPAEAVGGLKYLKSMAGPYNYLGLKYFPLGGVKQSSLAEYAQSDLIFAIGGSWIAKTSDINAHDYDGIRERAKLAVEEWNRERK